MFGLGFLQSPVVIPLRTQLGFEPSGLYEAGCLMLS